MHIKANRRTAAQNHNLFTHSQNCLKLDAVVIGQWQNVRMTFVRLGCLHRIKIPLKNAHRDGRATRGRERERETDKAKIISNFATIILAEPKIRLKTLNQMQLFHRNVRMYNVRISRRHNGPTQTKRYCQQLKFRQKHAPNNTCTAQGERRGGGAAGETDTQIFRISCDVRQKCGIKLHSIENQI